MLICIAPRHEHTFKVLRYGTRSQGISQFYCTPSVHPLTEWIIPDFSFQAEAGTHLLKNYSELKQYSGYKLLEGLTWEIVVHVWEVQQLFKVHLFIVAVYNIWAGGGCCVTGTSLLMMLFIVVTVVWLLMLVVLPSHVGTAAQQHLKPVEVGRHLGRREAVTFQYIVAVTGVTQQCLDQPEHHHHHHQHQQQQLSTTIHLLFQQWYLDLVIWLYVWHHSGPWSDFSYLGHSRN